MISVVIVSQVSAKDVRHSRSLGHWPVYGRVLSSGTRVLESVCVCVCLLSALIVVWLHALRVISECLDNMFVCVLGVYDGCCQ